jgi:O-antigen ligase
VDDRLTFNHGAATLEPRYTGRAERPLAARPAAPRAAGVTARVRAAAEKAEPAYWGVYAFTAMLFLRPQDTIPALEALHLADVTAVFALVAMGIRRTTRKLAPIPFTVELGLLTALGAVMVVTAPLSIWPSGALSTFTDLFLKVVLVFMLLTHSLTSPHLLRRFTWLIVLAMGYIAGRGVLDYARGENLLMGRLQGAVPGLVGNPNDLAMVMVAFLPFAAFAALGRGRPLPRAVAGLISVMMLATLLFTKSRAGFLALAVSGVLILLEARRIRPGITGIVLIAALVVPPLLPQAFWTRVSSIVNAEEDETGSRAARLDLLSDGWDAFLEHPITGVGAGQFQNYNPPWRREAWRETHNVPLQVLSELGLIGGLVFAAIIGRGMHTLYATWRMLRARRRDPRARLLEAAFDPVELETMRTHSAACIAAFAAWLIGSQFGSIGYHWTLYYVLGLAVAAHGIAIRRLEAARLDPAAAAATGRPA